MSKQNKCSFVDPESGDSCRLSRGIAEFYPHSGQHWCMHHLPVGKDEKLRITGYRIEDIQRDFEKQLGRLHTPGLTSLIPARGVHFIFCPLNAITRYTSGVDLSFSHFYENVGGSQQIRVEQFLAKHATFHGTLILAKDSEIVEKIDFSETEFLDQVDLQCKCPKTFVLDRAKFRLPLFIRPSQKSQNQDFRSNGTTFDAELRIDGNITYKQYIFDEATLKQDAHFAFSRSGQKLSGTNIRICADFFVHGDSSVLDLRPMIVKSPTALVLRGSFSTVFLGGGQYSRIDFRGCLVNRCSLRGCIVELVTANSDSNIASLDFQKGSELGTVQLPEIRAGIIKFLKCHKVKSVDLSDGRVQYIDILDCPSFSLLDLQNDARDDATELEIRKLNIRTSKVDQLLCTSRTFKEFRADDAKLSGHLDFDGAQFKGTAIFPEVLENYAKPSVESIGTYQTLKSAMAKVGNRNAQKLFSVLEQRAIRQTSGRFNRFLSYLYDFISQYGYSPGRPLLILSGVIAFNALVTAYTLSDGPIALAPIDWSAWGLGLENALRQSFIPFSALRVPGTSGTTLQVIFDFFCSLASVVLIAAFVLAIRWRFKTD